MARVRDIPINEVPEDVKAVYARYSADYGPFSNQVKIFAQRPPALKHIMGLLLDLKEEGCLPPRYLEIVLVVVSRINQCDYCVTHHDPRLVAEGLDQETVSNILSPTCPGLDDTDLLVRDFAIQVTNTPGQINDEIFNKLRTHFTEPQIVELVLRTALCGFFNRFNDALQIEIEDDARI
ncbi:MAG: carboxymuconolactone decarboxylase family protein [Pseudomonadota bacterium]|nr:carboxymuconolactone decarboxylase family protein [Pseudomonadota bacterium]